VIASSCAHYHDGRCFLFYPFNRGVRDGFGKGAKVADVLRKLWSGALLGGSQAHRFAKRSVRPVLRLTTPHSFWLLTLRSDPSRAGHLCVARGGAPCQPRRWPVTGTGLSCSITRLTLRYALKQFPPSTLLAIGHAVGSADAPFEKWCSLRVTGFSPFTPLRCLPLCSPHGWVSPEANAVDTVSLRDAVCA
jgi:hypothetical protein